MKSEHQQRIEQFMKLANQQVPDKPIVPSAEVRLLRAKLIFEEALETICALGFNVKLRGEYVFIGFVDFHTIDRDLTLAEIADGCCDLSVVSIGTLSACGIPDGPVLREVDSNNLAKFGPGSSIREDGKLIKPPTHKPPSLDIIIEALCGIANTGHDPDETLLSQITDQIKRYRNMKRAKDMMKPRERLGFDAGAEGKKFDE